MDRRLQLIQDLYGEVDDRPALRRAVEEDPALKREDRMLREMKFMMDHRPSSRPDEAVLETIFEAAAAPPAPPAPRSGQPRLRADRAAVPGRTPVRRTGRRMVMAAAIVCVAVVGWWRWDDVPLQQVADLGAAPAAPEHQQAAAPTLESTPQATMADVGTADEAMPAEMSWDASDDVLRLHRRIEMLEGRSRSLDWDVPVVPLEQMPAGGGQPGIQAARSNRR